MTNTLSFTLKHQNSKPLENLLSRCAVWSRWSRWTATLWPAARQAPLSMGSSKQEHWSGLPCPPPP